jgi:hypothetical protein
MFQLMVVAGCDSEFLRIGALVVAAVDGFFWTGFRLEMSVGFVYC